MPGNFAAMRVNLKTILLDFTAWAIYLSIIVLGAQTLDRSFWINTTGGLLAVIILFYFTIYFLLPEYLPSKKFILLVSWLIVLDSFCIFLRLLIVMLFQKDDLSDFADSFFAPVMFWNQFRVNLLFIGISFAYWYAQRNYVMEKNHQRMESEILNARLMSLKNQINPHFLHNTLSLLYTKSLPLSKELSDSIFRLSEMMRYSLAEADKDDKVSLEKEVNHLENYIEIHQMRFDHKLKINFDRQPDYSHFRIMPLLLITFVENAFKHGKLTDADHPLSMRLLADEKQIKFSIRNKKSDGLKERSSGIGLQNVRNRLELAYPGQHEFLFDNGRDEFIVILKLQLNA